MVKKKKQTAQNAETRPIKSWFVLVLQLISWEVAQIFWTAITERSKSKPL